MASEQPNQPPTADDEAKKLKAEEKKKAKEAQKAEKMAKVQQKNAKMVFPIANSFSRIIILTSTVQEEMKKAQEAKKKDKPEKEKELRLKKEFINTTPPGDKKGKKSTLKI